MRNQCYLSVFLWTLLMSSLLLSTWSTAQRSEDSSCRKANPIVMFNRRLAIALPTSVRGEDSGAIKISESDSLQNNMTKDHAALRRANDNLVKDSESVTIGIGHKLEEEMTQISSNSSGQQPQQVQLCDYLVVTQTGNQDGAGTDSDISLRLLDRHSNEVYFRHLGNGHRTFEKGHEDVFRLQDRPCVFDICRMVLSTDDYGFFSEWFVVSLKFSVATREDNGLLGPIVQERRWEINEWLPKEDGEEELYTIRDDCLKD